MKNKALIIEAYRAGTLASTSLFSDIQKGPLMFANSDQLRKMQARNKKHKR